jgi:hypothetical protein
MASNPKRASVSRSTRCYHEAVSVRHDPSQPDHVILESFQRGYRRGNEVFRPAKVVVNDLAQTDDGSGPDELESSKR